MGITSLLLKDGDIEDPDNYRAITVTAALSKLLAILVKGRLEVVYIFSVTIINLQSIRT